MPVSEKTYEQLALEDPDGQWELVCGRPRQKPIMTTEHSGVIDALYLQLSAQLDRRGFRTRSSSARVRISTGNHYIPDLCVVPLGYVQQLRTRPGAFEVYDDPLPLVVEVWSPSTGTYDVETKLKEYQWRGDTEIWRIHPYERTLTTWRRQPDGSYTDDLYRTGPITPIALPGVTIDIDTLFDE